MTSGIQLAGYPESCWIHCRSTPVRRGAIPATEAPDRNRPIMRNQAPIGWRRREFSPWSIGSCWSGSQMSGGSLRSVSPKNPGGAMPTTVHGS